MGYNSNRNRNRLTFDNLDDNALLGNMDDNAPLGNLDDNAPLGNMDDNAPLGNLDAVNKALNLNPALTRRSFVGAAAVAGALTFLGSLSFSDGTVINAYADEDGNTHFNIYVLGRDEVPIMAMRETSSGKVAASGVNVTITSLYNQKQLNLTTDASGFAAAKIRQLSFESERDDAERYTFYGEVKATCDGYREVFLPQEYIQSAVSAAKDGTHSNVIEIPIEIDDGSPYLRSVSLDNVDVLHSDAPAYVGSYNDMVHDLVVEVATADTSSNVEVAVYVDDQMVAHDNATREADKPNCAKATFSDTFLSYITPGQVMKVWFKAGNNDARTATLPLTFKRAILATSNGRDSFTLTPGSNPDGFKDTREQMPSMKWLFSKNDSFLGSIPGVPVQIWDDPSGTFGATVSLASWTFYKKVNGEVKTPEKAFKLFAGKAGSSAAESWCQDCADAFERAGKAYDDKIARNSFYGNAGFTSNITAGVELALMLYGKREFTSSDEKDLTTKSTADAAISVSLKIAGGFGWQLAVWFIPVFVNVDWKAVFQAKLAIGMAFKNWFEEIHWGHHYAGNFAMQFVLSFTLEAGLSVGVGVSGVLGVSVRGYANFKPQLMFDRSQDKKMPRGIISAETGLQLCVQFFFFTKSFEIVKPAKLGPIDSWDKKTLTQAADEEVQDALDEVDLSDAKMISQQVLSEVSEYEATLLGADESQALAATAAAVFADGLSVSSDADDDGDLKVQPAGMPARYARIRPFATEPQADIVAAGPASAPGFANPYAALTGEGELMSGASGTSDLAATGTQADFAHVSTYNAHLGLVPTDQKVLYEDVFSNTRLRTFVGNAAYNANPEDNAIMARLLVVEIPDGDEKRMCSRVSLRLWNTDSREFGDEQIVDFNVNGVSAANRSDIDFDLDILEYQGSVFAAIAITSVSVKANEDITVDETKSRQFVSFVAWNLSANGPAWTYSLRGLLDQGTATYHPRVLVQGNLNLSIQDGCRYCFYYFSNNPNNSAKTGIFISSFTPSGNKVCDNASFASQTEVPILVPEDYLVDGTFEVSSADRSAVLTHDYNPWVHTILAWRGDKKVHYSGFVRSFRFYNFRMFCDSQIGVGGGSLSRRGIQDTNVVFTAQPSNSTMSEKKNRVVKYDVARGKLSMEEVDGFSTASNVFSSSDGKRLYTVRLSEGSTGELSDEVLEALDAGGKLFSSTHYDPETGANYGGASYTSTVREPVYQLLESRWIPSLGAFHEFYPIARLAFPPDTVSILTASNGTRDFVMTSITDLDTAKSNVYQVSVPDIIAFQCESSSPESPFAGPGDAVGFFVTITNVGNALITGFDVTVYDSSNKQVFYDTYYDLRGNLQKTADNYHVVRDKTGKPTYNEDGSMSSEFVEDIRDTSGVLWPGFTRTYRFSFTMPEGYQGDTEFRVQISNPRSNPYANELSASAVLDSINAAVALAAAGESAAAAGVSGAGASDAAAAGASDAAAAGASGAGAADSTLSAGADHLSWLDADEFAESLFGSSVERVSDPRKMPFQLEVQTVSSLANQFSALPASYAVERSDSEAGKDETTGGGNGDDNGNGNGNGNGSAGAAADDASKTAPSTGDGASAATIAAAAVAAGAAGLAAKAALTGTEEATDSGDNHTLSR